MGTITYGELKQAAMTMAAGWTGDDKSAVERVGQVLDAAWDVAREHHVSFSMVLNQRKQRADLAYQGANEWLDADYSAVESEAAGAIWALREAYEIAWTTVKDLWD